MSKEEIPGSKCSIYSYIPTPGLQGRTFKLCVLTRWDINLCVRSFLLQGSGAKSQGSARNPLQNKVEPRRIRTWTRLLMQLHSPALC